MQLHTPISTQFKPKFTNGHGNRHQRRHQAHGGRRRHHPQVENGYRQAALQVVLNQGYTIAHAARCCATTYEYTVAMIAVIRSENARLLADVLAGKIAVLIAGAMMKNAAAVIAAYRKCSALERELFRLATGATTDAAALLQDLDPDQLVATSKTLGPDWIWFNLIERVMPAAETATELAVT
jgi:hypothetical protein